MSPRQGTGVRWPGAAGAPSIFAFELDGADGNRAGAGFEQFDARVGNAQSLTHGLGDAIAIQVFRGVPKHYFLRIHHANREARADGLQFRKIENAGVAGRGRRSQRNVGRVFASAGTARATSLPRICSPVTVRQGVCARAQGISQQQTVRQRVVIVSDC